MGFYIQSNIGWADATARLDRRAGKRDTTAHEGIFNPRPNPADAGSKRFRQTEVALLPRSDFLMFQAW